ncbi:hypothetical protein [Caproiciproducens galactitolivorans]|uniref:Uncharacterized protein n=1 Tax=Caproiciproducens galactitolivorans TaxID=642589 RepID=A0ABT4BR19_9FIRM|nr:hypothetical protein [Caproiciproducens galactitolivorans]MCY1713347.1 hypothetical protein [Caproiciproducens galactitolivorans]
MKIKSKRFLTVFLTLLFAASVFTATAFAQSDPGPITPPQQTSEPAANNSEPTNPGGETSKPEETSKPDETSKPAETSKPEEPPQPEATSKNEASSSQKNNSSKKTSSDEKPIFNHKVDTHNQKVEEAASRAAQTISTPDVLSSQDWGELLSSTSSSDSSSVAAAAGTTSSSTGSSGVGGVSWLLILGIVLIVLALCGIGLFVYLQFFSGSGGIKKNSIPAPVHKKSGEKPTEFVDISSYSDDQPHGDSIAKDARGFSDIASSSEKAPAAPVAPAGKAVQKPAISDKDETAPIPHEVFQRNTPFTPAEKNDSLPKSQAQPVNKSDFDWEKFFNEEK